jgi:hypothetical protein
VVLMLESVEESLAERLLSEVPHAKRVSDGQRYAFGLFD